MGKLGQFLRTSTSVLTIAEIGINHDGEYLVAKKLIEEAKWAGATAVKFQYRNLDNVYYGDLKEIGDEIVQAEVRRNFLEPKVISELATYAKSINLLVGISFFVVEDLLDFKLDLNKFDFFKIPSAEMMNFELIDCLLRYDVEVLVSTGAHTESQISKMLNRYIGQPIIPMHCVSNYPTMSFNSKIGYIKQLLNNWNGFVGYSSHDEDWKVAIVALSFGARVVERHLTLSKDSVGLDHSTSSTKVELMTFIEFARDFAKIASGDGPRYPNQGELINLQNLGRSFFAKSSIQAGSIIRKSDFVYRAPRTGISYDEFQEIQGKPLIRNIEAGESLTDSHVFPIVQLSDSAIETANDLKIALPTRLHDFEEIHKKFNLRYYELHLSYEEVSRLTNFDFIPSLLGLSVHLPDYISPNQLIDPFSENNEIRAESLSIITKLKEVVTREQLVRGIQIPIIGSFSVGTHKQSFYSDHFDLQDKLHDQGVDLLFQWLPPFAWYFGGASRIHAFNDPAAALLLTENKIGICLDLSHFKLGVEYWGSPLHDQFDKVAGMAKHFHISDAAGLDGEGIQFGQGSGNIRIYLDEIMQKDVMKVIEVWQGHLNNYAGFTEAINYIWTNYGK